MKNLSILQLNIQEQHVKTKCWRLRAPETLILTLNTPCMEDSTLELVITGWLACQTGTAELQTPCGKLRTCVIVERSAKSVQAMQCSVTRVLVP